MPPNRCVPGHACPQDGRVPIKTPEEFRSMASTSGVFLFIDYQLKTSCPFSVISTISSHWAEGLPSAV